MQTWVNPMDTGLQKDRAETVTTLSREMLRWLTYIPPCLMTWVPSLESTRWKGRTKSQKSACSLWLMCLQAHMHTKKSNIFYFKKVILFITKDISTCLPITTRGESVSLYKILCAYLSDFRQSWNKMIKLYCNNNLCLSATLLWGGFISVTAPGTSSNIVMWTEIECLCSVWAEVIDHG